MMATMIFGVILFLSAFLSVRTEQQKHVCLVGGPIFILLFGSQLWRYARVILIDSVNNTISFTNLFTRRQSVFSFDNFDGFVDMNQSARGGATYKVIYLVRQKKFAKKISSFYYSNLNELQEALTPIKYLGLQNFNIIKSVKILFNLRVLK